MTDLPWMRAPEDSLAEWGALTALAAAAHAEGFRRTLVCGMGGSSLVADVLATTFGAAQLHVLDSTNPAAVRAAGDDADLARTLFIISSKSGTTVETLAFCHYFTARARPEQFIAITETGSPLAQLAEQRGFRAVVPHPPGIGGRYSALTAIGMLPAALSGLDGRALLERTRRVDIAAARALGSRIGRRAQAGRDKLVITPPRALSGLAYWIEQLIAESSGKDGRGVVPIVADPVGAMLPDMQATAPTDFSVDPLDLGAEFLRWEYATEALCETLGVNAFDQPDVEEAKQLARRELAGSKTGAIAPLATMSLEALRAGAHAGDYFALLAYVPPTAATYGRLQSLRGAWGRALKCATTLGFGPRYLHSTGQLHKGGPNRGIFLVVTVDDETDLMIPDMGWTFGELQRAQARGDVRALLGKGRRVAHVHVSQLAELSRLEP